MGICNFKQQSPLTETNNNISKNLFQLHYIIGKGGFGKVWKVELKKNKELYAMKEMEKFRIYQKKSVTSVMNEKKLLENLKHDFIVNMQYAFQDKDNLYLILDYLPGGDLRYHLIKRHKFNEEETKFIIACIIIGLENLHSKNILQRDIKPENLVFDANGYLRMTDFGISRIWSPRNEADTSGTPGYMAPEVMMKAGHGIACDIFALGVIAYECMLGRRPYTGATRKEIRDNIINKQAKVQSYELPLGWSEHSADFVNKTLLRKPALRLGSDKPGILKNHEWFNGFDWDSLTNKTMKSPFEGLKLDEDMSHYFKKTDQEGETDDKLNFYKNSQIQKLFADYTFDKEKNMKKEILNKAEKEKVKVKEDVASTTSQMGMSGGLTKLTTVTANSYVKNY